MQTVYLLLGGNIGDRKQFLCKAISLIAAKIGNITAKSSVYETEPWGFDVNAFFLNQLVCVETELTPQKLSEELTVIEYSLGRERNKTRWSSRTIDIDILYYNHQIVEDSNLTIPHPLLHNRRFALVPLTETAPDFIHPLLKKTSKQLLAECDDRFSVKLCR